MENIFETLGAIFNPKIAQLESEIIIIEAQIKMNEPQNEYTLQVARSFHLGMVGGSGKNTAKLNAKREREIDKTINQAKVLAPLYTKKDNLKKQLEDIKNGTAKKRQDDVIASRIRKAEYWKNLKDGDELNIGNSNGNPIILKKSRLSILTTTGSKWTASEVIGKQAAKLI